MDLKSHFKKESQAIERALLGYLPKGGKNTSSLFKAMSYSVTSGGKRIRPILALEACRAVGGNIREALPAACALEMIHNYSLVHDDLPCMDDDRMRRGRPTTHVKFGEATALLAGDALLTLAFQILTEPSKNPKQAQRRLEVSHLIAQACGPLGMVGGQAMDMKYQDKKMDLATIQYINTYKSGALIAVSLQTGACLGGGSPSEIKALFRYGQAVGLLFQIADDMLDSQGYAKILGLTETRKKAQNLLVQAKKELKSFGVRGRTLSEIADFVLERKY